MVTQGDSISRVRNVLKAVKEDPFMTDRFIASLISKYAKVFIRRQDNENKLMRIQSLFEPISCIELIEVDKIEACCAGITSNCTIMRTKDKLPPLLEGVFGPIYRSVSSIDGSIQLIKTFPSTYVSMTKSTNFKYNTTKYFWFLDGYMYFPNIDWEAVTVEGLWDGDIAFFKCDDDKKCLPMQDQPLRIPEFLFAEIEQMVLKEILTAGQIPTDGADNQQNILR